MRRKRTGEFAIVPAGASVGYCATTEVSGTVYSHDAGESNTGMQQPRYTYQAQQFAVVRQKRKGELATIPAGASVGYCAAAQVSGTVYSHDAGEKE